MTQDLPTGPSRPTDYDQVKAKEDAARVERNRQAIELLTVMEPKSYGNSAVSQAISLKRIADVLEGLFQQRQKPPPLYGDMMGNVSGDPPTNPGAR